MLLALAGCDDDRRTDGHCGPGGCCDGVRVDVNSNEAHRGACGVACDTKGGMTCVAGERVCSKDLTRCGAECVDTQTASAGGGAPASAPQPAMGGPRQYLHHGVQRPVVGRNATWAARLFA